MKLKINGFENEIIFDNEHINILTITNPQCFSHIIQVINDKSNGVESNEIFLLDDNDGEINMSKEIYLLCDLFNIDYSSKKILNKLYKIISDNIQLTQDYVIEDLSIKLRNYIIGEINELPFEFTMKNELDIVDILKLYDLKIDQSNYTNVFERVEVLIDIISTLNVASILVIPNLKIFLSEQDLLELYKYSLYNNVKLLLIERKLETKLKYEKILAIDENFDEQIL